MWCKCSRSVGTLTTNTTKLSTDALSMPYKLCSYENLHANNASHEIDFTIPMTVEEVSDIRDAEESKLETVTFLVLGDL